MVERRPVTLNTYMFIRSQQQFIFNEGGLENNHLQEEVQALVEMGNAQHLTGSGGTLGVHRGHRCKVQQARGATTAC